MIPSKVHYFNIGNCLSGDESIRGRCRHYICFNHLHKWLHLNAMFIQIFSSAHNRDWFRYFFARSRNIISSVTENIRGRMTLQVIAHLFRTHGHAVHFASHCKYKYVWITNRCSYTITFFFFFFLRGKAWRSHFWSHFFLGKWRRLYWCSFRNLQVTSMFSYQLH